MQLSFEQVKSVSQGAVRILQTDGGIQFYRFTQAQEAAYRRTNDLFLQRTYCTAGIKLLFRTDSPWLELDVDVSKSMPNRSYFCFDVFSDHVCVGHMKNFQGQIQSESAIFDGYEVGHFQQRFSLGNGEKTVTVYFPWSVSVTLRGVFLADGATVDPVRPSKKLLTFGDSITQGFDASYPSSRYASKLADMLGAEEYCKAIGGECFFPALAAEKEEFEPDYISVAYGTNDWNTKEHDIFLQSSQQFLETLCKVYPTTKIFLLTPIWRKDRDEYRAFGSFDLIEQDLRNIVSQMRQVSVISCYDFVPKDSTYYADLRLHPNDSGFNAYASALASALEMQLK